MNQTIRNIFLILLLIMSVFLVPALMGGSIMDDIPEEDDRADGDEFSLLGNFSGLWTRIPVHPMSVLLRLGMSIFALCIVYLGGRSKHRRFNDRTIDPVNVLTTEFLKTARIRAVFCFLFLHQHLQEIRSNMQIIQALMSVLTLLMGSPVHGVSTLVPVKAPCTVHSRPIYTRRVKL